jgi:hypothetical protein
VSPSTDHAQESSLDKVRRQDHSSICFPGNTHYPTNSASMDIPAQYHHHQLHNLKLTASILAHLATHTPAIPGRAKTLPTRLPGIRSLFADATQDVVLTLPPLQCAVGLVGLGTPVMDQTPTTSPAKTAVGSPTSPGMAPINGSFQHTTASPSSTIAPSTPSPFSSISPKTRRPLSLHDLLSADSSCSTSTARTSTVHHRRQCGIVDCHKYALTGGFCIRHGGGKRCNVEGCQTVAQSGGRCKAHGGGSKCKVLGCGSVARRMGFCMAHGGRQQCKVEGCSKCAHGGGFCISHGGGKRCSSKDCNKSAQAGGFCYSHGGGKRCAAPECFQAARKGGLCIRHRKAGHRN